MISHQLKFIFVHINKNGGTSLHQELQQYYDPHEWSVAERGLKHQYIEWYTDYYKRPDYFKFTIVRNPWSRVVSIYNNRRERGIKGPHQDMNFSEYVEWLGNKDFNREITTRPDNGWGLAGSRIPDWDGLQLNWITDSNGEILVDYIGKLEEYQKSFNYICNKIGIKPTELPHLHRSKHEHYTKYYTTDTLRVIAEKYARDIEAFGYEFEG